VDPNEKKLWEAMAKDEEEQASEMAAMISVRDVAFTVVLKRGSQIARIKCRKLRDPEIADFRSRFGKIDKRLITQTPLTDPNSIQLTEEQTEQARDLINEFIHLSTGHSVEKLKELGDPTIRTALFRAIIEKSGATEKAVEAIQSFPENEPGL
jgi:hypothetical protein